MSATAMEAGGARGVARPEPGEGTGRRLRRRHLWLVPGLAVAILANELGRASGVGILALLAFGIAPDLPRLFRLRGRLAHSVMHQPLAPIAAVAIGATGLVTGLVPSVWLVGSLVWLGHVVAGLAIGDAPRATGAPDGASGYSLGS
jgi:hypothetical protein